MSGFFMDGDDFSFKNLVALKRANTLLNNSIFIFC